MSAHQVASVLLLAALVGMPGLARGETPQEQVQRGNAHYAAQRYAEALKCYTEAAAATSVPAPELLHNLAAAHFKLGEIEEARDLWVRLKNVRDPAFEARTHYNLGNCDYADALRTVQQGDAARAFKLLGQAVEQYREALRVDPSLDDARANLELTQALKRQIEEQLQNQPESQPSNQTERQERQDQQQEPSSQPSQPQSQPSEQQHDPNAPPESQPAQEEQSESQDQQQSSEQQPQEQEPERSDKPEDQEQPESRAASQPQTMPAETQAAPPEESPQEQPAVEMSREQAERLLQMIRDAEKARRERLLRERTARQKPVERDW